MYFSLLRDYLQFWNIQYCHHHYHHPPLRNFLGHLQERWYITIKLIPLQRLINIFSCFCSPDNTQWFFFSTLGLGPGPLELGKLETKLEIWEISHFNKPFRLEVCLRYLNNYNNKWMPVLSIGEIKYMITLHKKISYSFFKRNFGFGNFSGNFGKI